MNKTVDYSDMSKEDYETLESVSAELGCTHHVAAYLLALEGAVVALSEALLSGPCTQFSTAEGVESHEHVLFDNVDIKRIRHAIQNSGLHN